MLDLIAAGTSSAIFKEKAQAVTRLGFFLYLRYLVFQLTRHMDDKNGSGSP
ncbi:hypothetical protein ACK333_02385 [Aeromonas veronii]